MQNRRISRDAEVCVDELAEVIRREKLDPDAVTVRLEMISYFYKDILSDDTRDWVLNKLQGPLEEVRIETEDVARILSVLTIVRAAARELFDLETKLQVIESLTRESVAMSESDERLVDHAERRALMFQHA